MADHQCFQDVIVLFVCCLFVGPVYLETKTVKVKIVDEPAVYRGVNSFYQQQHQAISNTRELEARVDPIPFAGPQHFSVLSGKCYSLVENSYKYELCPFHNVTQKEQTVRWNAFAGILGVFQGWDIVNNTFVDMLMAEGDYCPGNNPRQTKVIFKCGDSNKLMSVSEPATCRYKMDFETPLACPEDALLVYPVLSEDGRSKWESIEEDLWREELTLQGYNKQRQQLFISEGLMSSGETTKKEETAKRKKGEKEKDSEGKKTRESTQFSTLELCEKAYKELQSDLKILRHQLSERKNQSTKQTNNNNGTTTMSTQTQPSSLSWRNKPHKDSIKLNTKIPKQHREEVRWNDTTTNLHKTAEFQKFKDAASRIGKIIKHKRN